MKKISFIFCIFMLLLITTINVICDDPPCKPEGESDCDWIEAEEVIEFHLNPQIQG